ncbi:MAG: D-glycero-beta-D-manno-heptose-7-phosphate kinase [Candidatus Brocadiae bacterium]|nr:D-glycero-beta-D-manno-heptose-7-phosphate kinase [Candidatus Brocadiia bacterium]
MSRLSELLRTLGKPRILVVGDLLLDRYLWGKVDRISPEAPVPVLNIVREEERAGGAANVACNLVALGASASLAGAIGPGAPGERLVGLLREAGIDTRGIVVDPGRPTPIKTRCIAQSQQMLRVDRELAAPLAKAAEKKLLRHLQQAVAKVDLVLLSDYNKGVLTDAILAAIMRAAKKHGKPVVVGPKGLSYDKYAGCTGVVPNLKELALATGLAVGTDAGVRAAASALLRDLGCGFVLVTRGDRGMSLFREGSDPFHVPSRPRQVYDVAGAGDTSVATLGLALACGAAAEDAVRLANAAGGIAVTKVGVATVSRAEIQADLEEEHSTRPEKVRTATELVPVLAAARARGETVAFTNGCFDILHAGHVRTLHFARSQGDLLVVGINSDASVRRLKGAQRPIVPERERAAVLAALQDVDHVVIFGEDTPVELMALLKPDVIVKGGDYTADKVVGAAAVKAWGGRVAMAPLQKGASTTNIVEKIRRLK